MRSVRLALYGTGNMSRSYCDAVSGRHPFANVSPSSNITIDTVVSVNRGIASAREFAGKYRIPRVSSTLDEILADPAIDGVIVSTRHHQHIDPGIKILKSGKALLMEKPLALSVAECRRLTDLCRQALTPAMMVGYWMRYLGGFAYRVRKHVPNPKLIVGRWLDLCWPEDFWAQDETMGGGNVLSQVVHIVNLACFLSGSAPTGVSAVGGVWSHAKGPVDTAMMTIRFESGCVANLLSSDCGPSLIPSPSLEVFDGINAASTSSLWANKETLFATAGKRTDPPRLDPDCVGHPLEDAARCIRGEPVSPLFPSIDEGLRDVRIIQAAFESTRRSARSVSISDEFDVKKPTA